MTSTLTPTETEKPTNLGCVAGENQLRWEYTVAYRRHHRQHPTTNDYDADQTACEHLRTVLPIVLARHLPGIQLVEWVDPHPAVIDSTWTINNTYIEIYWDYHPNWAIGDASALTIQATPASEWPGTETP